MVEQKGIEWVGLGLGLGWFLVFCVRRTFFKTKGEEECRVGTT